MVTPAVADIHPATPTMTKGPYFPDHDQLDKDANLLQVNGRSGKAQGEVIFVSGTIRDIYGNPIGGAVIDMWQANKWGRYDHEDDPNPAPLDPNFQGWAKLMTASDGKYNIMTVKPGAYPQGSSWRAPHLHFRVRKRGYEEIGTQMFFKGEPLNDDDGLLLAVRPKYRRDLLVVDFGSGIGKFDLVLQPRRG